VPALLDAFGVAFAHASFGGGAERATPVAVSIVATARPRTERWRVRRVVIAATAPARSIYFFFTPVGRMSPSWATLATIVPSRVKKWPRVKPRAPCAAGLSCA